MKLPCKYFILEKFVPLERGKGEKGREGKGRGKVGKERKGWKVR